jgi:hypothetical protein
MALPPRPLPAPHLFGQHPDLAEQLAMDELFLSSTFLRKQCYHACCVMSAIPRSRSRQSQDYTVVAGFRDAGVSLIMDNDRAMRSNVTPHTGRCLLEPVSREEPLGLAEEEEDGEELNIQEYILRCPGDPVKREGLRRPSRVQGN